MQSPARLVIFLGIILGFLTADIQHRMSKTHLSDVLGTETSSTRRLSLSHASTDDSVGIKMAFFNPAPPYLHIVHDMGAHFFDYGLDPYNPAAEIGQKDYEWIARAFNTAVIGYPGPGINDIPARASIKAATENNVRVIIAGGHYSYIAQKIAQNPNISNIIGYRIFDEYVPENCEKRRYPAAYPGLGPPCTLAEFIAEGQKTFTDVSNQVRQFSDVPLMMDFIPVELAYSADNPTRWATERPGNSNAALTGYLQACTLDHLFLSLGADDETKGGLSIEKKVAKAKELWKNVTCQDGTIKEIKIGLRYGGGGFDEDRFADFAAGQRLITEISEQVEQAVAGGADSVDIYPWRHLTSVIDRKTLDLVWLDASCTDKNNPNCAFTGATNPYYETLVNLYQGAKKFTLVAEEKAPVTDENVYNSLSQTITCALGFNCPAPH